MIPDRVIQYLHDRGARFIRVPHRREVTAQKVAEAIHETGYHMAKAVIVEVENQKWIAVLPAPALIDVDRIAELLNKSSARLLDEDEMEGLFPDCELGAEPPFGELFGMRVVMDDSLTDEDAMIVRAGTHDEAVKLSVTEFLRLEHPRIGTFAVLPEKHTYAAEPDIEAP